MLEISFSERTCEISIHMTSILYEDYTSEITLVSYHIPNSEVSQASSQLRSCALITNTMVVLLSVSVVDKFNKAIFSAAFAKLRKTLIAHYTHTCTAVPVCFSFQNAMRNITTSSRPTGRCIWRVNLQVNHIRLIICLNAAQRAPTP